MTERKQTHVVDLGAALKRSVERPTLAELQAVSLGAWRRLLTPVNYMAADTEAALAEGLVDWGPADEHGQYTVPTPKGRRYLAALRAILEGLTKEQHRVLTHAQTAPVRWEHEHEAHGELAVRGLVRPEDYPGLRLGLGVPTDLGAALLLLEREDVSRG